MAKRNASGGGSIRQRPNGKWEARFTVGYNPATGKQIRKSVYGDTQAGVRKALAAAVAAVDNHTYKEQEKKLLSVWLDEWYKNYCEGLLKPFTCIAYEVEIRKHIKPYIGSVRLCDLNTSHIQGLVRKLQKQGLSAKTVKNVHSCLSSALEQARREGSIAHNPCEFAKLPKVQQQEIKPLTLEQMHILLDTAKDDPYEKVITICLFCGLRKGEALGLSWKQVDFDKAVITVKQQLQSSTAAGYYILNETKNGKPRTLDAPPFIMQMLKDVQQAQRAAKLKAGKAWANEWGLVFTNPLGEHLSRPTMQTHFKRILAAASLPSTIRIHDLRHPYVKHTTKKYLGVCRKMSLVQRKEAV